MTATHNKKKTRDYGKLCHFYSKKVCESITVQEFNKITTNYMYMLVQNVIN